jgi:chitinase
MKTLNLFSECLGLLIFSTGYAIPILSIVPSITSTTLKANSVTEVSYTVTNNAGPMTGIIINPAYQTNGQPSGITLTNNTCSSLGQGGICTFSLLISGANQPSTFEIRPRMCAFNGLVCSVPVETNILNVNVNPATQAFAYFSSLGSPNPDILVPVIMPVLHRPELL